MDSFNCDVCIVNRNKPNNMYRTAHFLKDITETGYHLGDSVSQKVFIHIKNVSHSMSKYSRLI